MKTTYVFLADGFEDIEAITVIDVLRRANFPVKTVSIMPGKEVKSAHGNTVIADLLFDEGEYDDARWLILPGGMPGAENLYKYEPLCEALRKQAKSAEGRIAAICAAPAVVLGQLGLLKNEAATCYPGFEGLLNCREYVDRPVVESGKYITGNGPGNALLWAFAIVYSELGEVAANQLAAGMLVFPRPADDCEYTFG